jgi:hypothetical protein
MPTEKPLEPSPQAEQPPVEREPYIPKPPSREALEQISREQALITDEWSGEEPKRTDRGTPDSSR